MTPKSLDDFREIWLADFEFRCPAGETPTVVCMVAREYHSGRLQRQWWDILWYDDRPPFPIDSGALYVAYYASAEMLCHLSLGWPLPVRAGPVHGVSLPDKRPSAARWQGTYRRSAVSRN